MTKHSTKKVPKSKAMMYTQDHAHAPWADLADLEARITALDPKKWAIITHDQDIDDKGQPVRDHEHAMLVFENARSITAVAKALGDQPQYIEAWRGDTRNGFAYLCHRTKNSRSKHQYDPTMVRASFDYPAELEKLEAGVAAARTAAKVPILLDALYEGDLTRDELKAQLTGSQIGRYKRQIEDVFAARLEREAAEWRAKMRDEGRTTEVIWLFGPTATGKTSLAKELATARGSERGYFMRGSSRGIFENYEGQHELILDELSPESIPYEDLKRITDPNAIEDEIHAPSRYRDKMLMAELIIFTSPYNPLHLYSMQDNPALDAFDQFARRVSVVLNMSQTEIQAMQYDPKQRKYLPIPGTTRSNKYSATARTAAIAAAGAPQPDPLATFNGICDTLNLAA